MFVYNSVIYIWGGFKNITLKDILLLYIFWSWYTLKTFISSKFTLSLKVFYCNTIFILRLNLYVVTQLIYSINLQLFALKKCSYGAKYSFFFNALVLMLLSKFVPNCTFRRCCFCIFFYAKLALNFLKICPKWHQKKVFNLHHTAENWCK